MFSPGNLRATFDNPAYEKLISYYIGEKYTLRYTGGMVPDVFQVGGVAVVVAGWWWCCCLSVRSPLACGLLQPPDCPAHVRLLPNHAPTHP